MQIAIKHRRMIVGMDTQSVCRELTLWYAYLCLVLGFQFTENGLVTGLYVCVCVVCVGAGVCVGGGGGGGGLLEWGT